MIDLLLSTLGPQELTNWGLKSKSPPLKVTALIPKLLLVEHCLSHTSTELLQGRIGTDLK